MKTVYSIIVGAIVCFIMTTTAFASDLKMTINVESGDATTQIVGADVYALINNKLTEITVVPDDMAFRTHNKFGALRINSFWLKKDKVQGDE
jgi:hypothetical protein